MIQFKDLPVEIQERMLDEQVRQGNPRNAKALNIYSTKEHRGFDWAESVDGYDFWKKNILDGTIAVFYEKYPKRPLRVEDKE